MWGQNILNVAFNYVKHVRYIKANMLDTSSNAIKKDRNSETHASNFDVRLDTYKNFTLPRYIGLTEASLKSLFSEVPWKTVYGG